MMNKYEVKITNEALSDMEMTYEYIAYELLAPENAMGQYNRIAKAILALDSFPERTPLFDMEPEHSLNLRKMSVDNYLVFYIIDAEVVTVTDVLYGASNVQARLNERHQ